MGGGRDPKRDPRPGDVVVTVRKAPWGEVIQHHLGVTARTARIVWALDGNWTEACGGIRGGSPQKWSLAGWRAEVADGRVAVVGEDGRPTAGWDAIVESWKAVG